MTHYLVCSFTASVLNPWCCAGDEMSSDCNGGVKRRATHAGSWYTSDGRQLRHELDQWLARADSGPGAPGPARAIISPHAGYRYCGACGAHAFKQVRQRFDVN